MGENGSMLQDKQDSPASNTVDDTRICDAFEYTTEKSNDIHVLDVFDECREECQDTPDNLEAWNQDIRSAKCQHRSLTQEEVLSYRILVNNMLEGIMAAQ